MPDYFAPPGGRPEREYPVDEGPNLTPSTPAYLLGAVYGHAAAARVEADRVSTDPLRRTSARTLDTLFKRPGRKNR